jgi:taspase (threonine aspartase 1)
MEDNPVTNAGYGSNLTEDGLVAGDATMVNNEGRSGAVGALTRKLNLAFCCELSLI